MKIKNTDIAKELCLPPVKLHCSSNQNIFKLKYQVLIRGHVLTKVLAEDAIRAAIQDYKQKKQQQ